MKRFIIDGTPAIVGEDEKPFGAHTIGSTIQEALWKNSTHDTMRCYDFGLEMKRTGKLDLLESDFRFVEEVVNKCVMMAQFKCPVIRALNKAKDEAKDV